MGQYKKLFQCFNKRQFLLGNGCTLEPMASKDLMPSKECATVFSPDRLSILYT